MIELKEHIKKYLEILKVIQEMREPGYSLTPYALEIARQDKHSEIVDCLMVYLHNGTDRSDVYIRSKEIFNNLDKVNRIYSTAAEWRLRTDEDIHHLTNDLYHFLTSRTLHLFLEGKKEKLFCD